MTLVVPPTRRAEGDRAAVRHGPGSTLPSWPVDALLWGFPVWWLLGMTPFFVIVMAGVMAVLMVGRAGSLRLVPGIGALIAFVAWVVPAAVMLDDPLRLVGYGLRFANMLAVLVVAVYVVNARHRISVGRVVAGLTAVWAFVVVGGYLGVLLPDLRLTTPVGVLLPETLTSNEYVRDLVSPPFAEVQQPWGAPAPFERPSAPFPYANSWGTALVLLTPVVVAQIVSARRLRTRVLLSAGIAASMVPAVLTSNRGMFAGLVLSVGYVAVRLALRGRVLPFLGLVGTGLVAGGALVAAGVLEAIATRQTYSDSTGTRSSLYAETFTRTLDSPLLGFGAPRPSVDHAVSVGTQGHVWMVMFSYGFVGLALFLLFLWGATLRTLRTPDTRSLWLHSVLVCASVIVFFYGLDTVQLLSLVLVATVLLRERAERPVTAVRPR